MPRRTYESHRNNPILSIGLLTNNHSFNLIFLFRKWITFISNSRGHSVTDMQKVASILLNYYISFDKVYVFIFGKLEYV